MSTLVQQLALKLNQLRPAVPLVLRIVVGGLFVWHGINKFDTGIAMVEGAYEMWNVPLPGLAAPLTAIVEIAAGLALVIGLGTRVAAAALAVVMIGAIVFVKADLGIISSTPMPGAELDLALLAGLIAVLILGPGVIALDSTLGLEPAKRGGEVTA